MNTTKLRREQDHYIWVRDTQATEPMLKANAKAFGVWWLRISRDQVEAGIDLLKEKHNTAFFSEREDFLYVDTIQ